MSIELPGHDVSQIDATSVRIQGSVAPDLSSQPTVGDRDRDGLEDLSLRFSRTELVGLLSSIGAISLRVTGALSTGHELEGFAHVTVVGGPGSSAP